MIKSKIISSPADIIQVRPVEDVFTITWIVDLRCNYDCMYCPPKRHDNTSEMKSLEQLKSAWIQVFEKTSHLGKKYKLALSGGEVTVNKNFRPFLHWLRENYDEYLSNVGITSNGSASESYYLDIFQHLDWMSHSTHTEYIDIEKFFSTAKSLSSYANENQKSYMINIMDERWAGPYIAEFKKRCIDEGINFSINEIDWERRTREQPIFFNGLRSHA